MKKTVLEELKNNILFVQLNTAQTGHSLTLETAESLVTLIRNHPQAEGLVLLGSGRHFCTGGNLKEYAALKNKQQGLIIARKITKCLDFIYTADLPKLCFVNGDCFGGGIELMSAFDYVIAVPHAFFGFWQPKNALSFGWGGGKRLTTRISNHNIKRALLVAETLTTSEALRIGLIDAIVLESQFLNAAQLWFSQIQALPRGPQPFIRTFKPSLERAIFEKLWWRKRHRELLDRF